MKEPESQPRDTISPDRKAELEAMSDEEQVRLILYQSHYPKAEVDYVFKILTDRGWILLMDVLM
ncbi:MAG: hypothetical protein R6V45_01960 [Oceanipulchritudo sp.]